ncbi:MAG TPA: phage portal protein [Acinetobacter sp.]|nr:phage portal protein [Acinetobacter sp.]
MSKWWQFWKKEEKSSNAIRSIMQRNSATWSAREFVAFATEGYRDNPTVRACIMAKQKAAIECPIILVNEKGEAVESHQILALLNKPNPMQSWEKFLTQMIGSHDIAGEGDVLKIGIGQSVELWPLRPDWLEITTFSMGLPVTCSYTPSDTYEESTVKQYQFSELMIWAEYNPLFRWRGLSPLYSAAYSIDTLNEYAKSNKAMLENGMTPSGVLWTDSEVSDTSFSRLQEQFNGKYAGAKNSGKPMILDGGLKWQGMSFSPRDMEFVSGKRLSQFDVCQVLRVPPQIIGIEGSQTFANYEQARAAFYEDEVIPMVNGLLSELLNFLRKDFKLPPTYKLIVDTDGITALEPRRAERNKVIDGLTSLKVDEKRAAMGYQSTEGGDVILVDSNKIPLDMAGADIPPLMP